MMRQRLEGASRVQWRLPVAELSFPHVSDIMVWGFQELKACMFRLYFGSRESLMGVRDLGHGGRLH